MSTSRPTVPVARTSRTPIVLLVVLTAQLMLVLDAAIVNIALPDIQHALRMTSAGLSWVVNAYTLAFGGLLLLGARAGDVLGRRRVFLAGLTVFTGSSLLGGMATGPAVLLVTRAAQGAGAALAAPSALALLLATVRPGRERTRAIGWYTVVSASGAAIGLIAGGVLTSLVSWRWVFFVNVPIGLAILVLGTWALPAVQRRRERVDIAGALLVTVGMTSLVYGFIRAASDGWTDLGTIAAFGAGITLLLAFVGVELRIAEPITPLHLFADRERSTAYIARLLLVAGSMGTFFFMSQFMQIVLRWTPLQSGLAFLPIPVAVFAASQVVSRTLTGQGAHRAVTALGLALAALGLLWMARLDATSGYLQMLPGLVAFGLGNGISFVPLTSAGVARVAPADSGAASGLVNVTQQLGGSLGLAILVTVFATASHGPAGAAPAHVIQTFVTGADRGFLVAGLLAVAAMLLVLVLMPGGHGETAAETASRADDEPPAPMTVTEQAKVPDDEPVPAGR